RPWLRADDATGAATLAEATGAAALPVAVLALVTAGLVPLVDGAARHADWRRLTLLLAWGTVAWTATFEAVLHPAIARDRSPRAFLADVDRLVPPDAPLYARYSPEFPPDPGLRFYAPRPLRPWPAKGLAGG